MSSRSVSAKQKWLAAALYLVILSFAILFWFFSSKENIKLQEELDARLQLLDRIQSNNNEGLNSAPVTATGAMFGEMSSVTETIAASDLQKRLLEMAANSGVVVHSVQTQVNADSDPQQFRRISSELTFDGKIESLQQFLFEVETNVPFIFVDAVTVQPSPSDAKKDAGEATLRVTVTTSAYWKNPQVDENAR